ncbi:transcriptional regulator [Rhizobium sp. ICMP 5592]|nr:transcriptional regulator [Rhizobium sp. ICMP 5592]
MLAAQLRELEADGRISRQIFAEVPPRVEYSITPAAHTLKPVMQALFAWWHVYKGKMGEPPKCDVEWSVSQKKVDVRV